MTFFYRSRFTRNHSSRYLRRAVELLTEAAAAGNTSAMSFLAVVYDDAWGVPQDLPKAIYWLQLAAKAGHPLALFNLGVAYDNGLGVTRNPMKAWKNFHQAATTGYSDAQFSLAHMLFQGEGVAQDYQQAREWASKAAQQNHPESMQLLGTCLLRGLGGPALLPDAQQWLHLAVAAGSSTALQRLQESWEHPENDIAPEAQIHLLTHLIEAKQHKQVQIQALYTLGCLGLQFPHLLPPHRPAAKDYFRWAAKFKHTGAALQLARLEGEEF